MLNENGRLCLLQPSGLLYNAKSRDFASWYLKSRTVETVLDFSSIRNLFEKADPKALALLVRPKVPEAEHVIRHLTFRRTKSVHERLGFELDHYDFHEIPQNLAEESPWVWKANLLGEGDWWHWGNGSALSKTLNLILLNLTGTTEKDSSWRRAEREIPRHG